MATTTHWQSPNSSLVFTFTLGTVLFNFPTIARGRVWDHGKLLMGHRSAGRTWMSLAHSLSVWRQVRHKLWHHKGRVSFVPPQAKPTQDAALRSAYFLPVLHDLTDLTTAWRSLWICVVNPRKGWMTMDIMEVDLHVPMSATPSAILSSSFLVTWPHLLFYDT